MVNFTHKIVLITVALLCSLSVSAYDFEVDGYRYNITSLADLTVEVVGTPIGTIETNKVLGIETTEEITIPSSVHCSDPNDPLDVSPILSETGTTAIGIFDLNGKRISTLEKGINIIKYSDCTTKKVIVK